MVGITKWTIDKYLKKKLGENTLNIERDGKKSIKASSLQKPPRGGFLCFTSRKTQPHLNRLQLKLLEKLEHFSGGKGSFPNRLKISSGLDWRQDYWPTKKNLTFGGPNKKKRGKIVRSRSRLYQT